MTPKQQIIEIRDTLNAHTYKDLPLGSLVFRSIYQTILEENTFSLKRLAKSIFFRCAILVDRTFAHSHLASKQDILVLQTWHRPNHIAMWDAYLTSIKRDTDAVLRIQYNERNFIPCFPFGDSDHRRAQQHVLSALQLKGFRRWYVAAEILFHLKIVDFLLPTLDQFTCTEVYCDENALSPGSVFALYFQNKNIPTFSFQFYSLTPSRKFKISTELTWINMNVDTMYVWGDVYKNFLKSEKPNVSFPVIGHPLYQNTEPGPIQWNPNIIVIGLNPPDTGQYNYHMIAAAKEYARVTNADIYLQLHPVDSIARYQSFVSNIPTYRGTVTNNSAPHNAIFLVNESTLYFDLIAENRVVLRYVHPDSYQETFISIDDDWHTTQQLADRINQLSTTSLAQKKNTVLKAFFNA